MGAARPEESTVALIVGLGNPGPAYEGTRHNAGFLFVRELARTMGADLRAEPRFHGLVASALIEARPIRFLLPTRFMNKSGLSVAALANFYRIPAPRILVAHDELDIPVGTLRLKQGGGHGGHNGLRDIISCLGNDRTFCRLRIGIGHPGSSDLVTNYVLSRPGKADSYALEASITEAVSVLPDLIAGHWDRSQQRLHSFSPPCP
ncbi:MAG: aminoacyl-tRNA hydrolase [Kistimonas sp.]|nr:aminoacyl-tRNA hydrolase [Kistimonas sp.]